MGAGHGREGGPRAWSRPVPPARVWRDWALVGVLTPVALLEGLLRPDLPWRPVALALGLGLVPTLLWRRTHPLLMIAITFGAGMVASVATTGRPPELDAMVYLLLLPYALTRWGEGRAVPAGLAIAAAADLVSFVADPVSLGSAVGGLIVLTASAALGSAFRYRASARLREFEQVKLMERERLARDLHDTVAHHVSAIAIRAQAGLATAPANPAAALDALRLIEAEAKRTLGEMRAMVRVLRRDMLPAHSPGVEGPGVDGVAVEGAGVGDGLSGSARAAGPPVPRAALQAPRPEDLAPAPGLADLARLADDDRPGPRVAVRVAEAVDGLAPPVATAIYRLAQESVTNARRHARGATRIDVDVTIDTDVTGAGRAIRLRVRDDGDTSAPRTAPSPGYGLLGMRERVELLGGTFEAGPDRGPGATGGWTVQAVLPQTGQPA